MPFENTILKRNCVEEFEQLYKSLFTALLSHDNILLLAPLGVGKMCSTVKALQNQPEFNEVSPRILLLVHDPYVVNEFGRADVFAKNHLSVMQITPELHTNKLIRQLRELPDMVMGTPAKILDLIQRAYLDINIFDAIIIEDVSHFQYLGYYDQLQQLMEMANGVAKVIFTSSLENQEHLPMPFRVKPHLVNQLRLNFPFKFHAFTLISNEAGKPETLLHLLCELFPRPTIVFCNHRGAVIRLEKFLVQNKLNVGMVHGGMEDEALNDTMALFKNGSITALLTTDMAMEAGQDLDIKYLVHYQMPLNNQTYQRRNAILMKNQHFATAFHLFQEDEDQPDFIQTLPDVIEVSEQRVVPSPWWGTIKLTSDLKVEFSTSELIHLLTNQGKLHRDEIGLPVNISGIYYLAVAYRKAQKVALRLDGIRFKNTRISAIWIEKLYD